MISMVAGRQMKNNLHVPHTDWSDVVRRFRVNTPIINCHVNDDWYMLDIQGDIATVKCVGTRNNVE